LIHISELAPQRVIRVTDIVKPEQEVQVKIVSVDPAAKRIGLSLKGALPKEEAVSEPVEEETPAGPERPRRRVPLRGGVGQEFTLPELPQDES